MTRSCGLAAVAVVLAAVLGGCGGGSGEPVGAVSQASAHPGPWVIPEETLAIGDTQWVEYTGAGPWIGESGCSGGITPGAEIVRTYLYAHFPQIESIGGYDCRPIVGDDSSMSVHGTGRALDLMIPLDGGDADNDLGDPAGNFLVENAQAIGIQYVIWDRWSWRADRDVGAKGKSYGGANPHIDHLHIELSVEASEHTSPWFEGEVTPPAIPGCDPVGAEGAIIDDASPCVRLFGDPQYWRSEQGVGYDGGLHWTNAFQSDTPSNWARWTLSFVEAGSYDVELYLEPSFAVADGVPYEVVAGEQATTMTIDQSAGDGWTLLGTFDFAAGGEQSVDVFDDQPEPVAADQHIAVDALRLTRVGLEPPEDPEDPPDGPTGVGGAVSTAPAPEPAGISGADSEGGCALGARPHRAGAAGAMLAALVALGATRRSRRRAR